MDVDVGVGNGEVISGRQAFLFRTVFRIGLHVLAEDVARDGSDNLIGGHGTEAPDRMPPHGEGSWRPQVGVFLTLQCQRVINPDTEEMPTAVGVHHVLKSGDDVARTDVAAAETGCAVINARDTANAILAVDPEQGVAERRLDLSRQVIARRAQRIVHPLEHGKRQAIF
ncbi:hypothetical protein HRbin36_02353 [bacterium HR36]|nr:hypothetical protein HRbin36_02353 [bacterium HR36]